MDKRTDIESVGPSEARSEGLSEKRPLENGELGVQLAKKARGDGELAGNVRKVAEIVLVLATMGKMRAGRKPTAAEVEMMAEAREKLAEVCVEFAPKDIFPRDAFGAVIEDLGLSKLREQRLGLRPPKMSIAEKLQLAQQKMEKSVEFSQHSATYSSQRLQTNLAGSTESRGASHAVRMFTSDKPSHAPVSSKSFQHPSHLVHASPANSTSLPYQLPTSEVRPVVPSVLPGSHLGRDSSSLALPRVDRSHFRLDVRSNGSPYSSQAQANSSGDHATVKTPTWSMQPQSASTVRVGHDKVSMHSSVKVEGAADANMSQMAAQATVSKPFVTQTTPGNPPSIHQHLQGIKSVQAPNTHNDIGKIVQKLLQPQLPEKQTWTPPSRDYMNKALTCQVCKIAINEVDTALVCDACEKGYHLRCLAYLKGIPKGEWHCGKCLSLSNGKPLPPKYGRVMRNISTQKILSQGTPFQASLEKKVETSDEKVNQQQITANGNSGLQSASTGYVRNNCTQMTSSIKMEDSTDVQGGKLILQGGKMDDNFPSETCPNNVIRTSEAASISPSGLSVERSCDKNLGPESRSQPPATFEAVTISSDHSQALGNHLNENQTRLPNSDEILSKQSKETNLMVHHSGKSPSGETLACNSNGEVKQEHQGVERANPSETSASNIGAIEQARSSPNNMHDVEWIGDILKVDDEKNYYQSCCINGVVYKVEDHALFPSPGNKYTPSKLQAMWEDCKTSSKWVSVKLCYFPSDLPKGVGRPCSSESNEVYESNQSSTLMAGLIYGPCEVLPPSKFDEESERRTRLGTGASVGLRPLFLCKWLYDESKEVFRDVTC